MKTLPPPVVKSPHRTNRGFFDRTPRPCGCQLPLGCGALCPQGQALFAAETAARRVYLDQRTAAAARAYQAARQAYDAHVGLDSTAGTQP